MIPLLLKDFLADMKLQIISAVALFILADLYAVIKYRKIPAFHMYSNKTALAVAGAFVIHALIFSYSRIFAYAAIACLVIMSLEQIVATTRFNRLEPNLKSAFVRKK